MTSLFSSFDLILFSKVWVSFFFIFFLGGSSIFFITSLNDSFNLIKNGLVSFFYSLKMKSFNKFSSLMFMSFIIILVYMNFFSVFSFNFPLSSQVSVMFFFSFTIWLSFIIFSFKNSINKSLYHFIPEGTPMALTFLLFLIELISNVIRPITLMVRLVANILAGHLLMILLSNLVFHYMYVLPLYVILNLVEIFVSLIQTYIFATMMVLYYSEV